MKLFLTTRSERLALALILTILGLITSLVWLWKSL